MDIEWEIVQNPEQDPEVNRLLDALSELSRKADTIEMWIA